jgi:transcription antitermination factor NusA-like protein
MQAPICEVCLNSELLCAGCADKLARGEIAQAEIDVARTLYGMSEKIRSLKDVKLRKVIDSDVLLLVAGAGDGARLVGKGGAVVKDLAKTFGKSIRVLEEKTDMRAFASELISPAALLGINTVYRQEGESFRLRIPEVHRRRLAMSPETIVTVLSSLYGCKVEIVFEP